MVAAFRARHRPLGETEAPGPHNIRVPEYSQAPFLITLGPGPEIAHEVSLNPCFRPKLRQVILSLGALALKLTDLALTAVAAHPPDQRGTSTLLAIRSNLNASTTVQGNHTTNSTH
jgi:hypothetical protein